MVGGVGESRPAVEVDNFESSFNLSHPPEHLFPSLSSDHASLFFDREPLFLHSNAFVSRCGFARCNILLKSCHVREAEHRLGDKK